jgi:hypothetical protein
MGEFGIVKTVTEESAENSLKERVDRMGLL